MTDKVNDLIQNAFENPAQFSFESSSSGLTQDLARLYLGDNNRADKILSNAEKESLMKEIFPLKNTNYSVPHENEVLWEDIWNTVCTRRCKFYRLPTGKIGKQYVQMLNCELELFLKSNIPSKRLLVFSALILHRDNKVKHSKDVKITIENRMKEWSVEKFQPLVQSFKRCTQFSSKAVRIQKSDPEEKLRAFAKMVQEGNIKNATRFLADENGTSVLKPSDLIEGRTVTEILQEKHSKTSPLFEGTFNISELPLLEKLNITSSTVEKQARKLFGSSGPSGSDANHWFDALIRFGLESSRLRDLVSQLGNLIAYEIISWRKIKALFSCRLIALDKQPGVRPIGIGETLRRLLGKAVADLTNDDLAYAFGSEELAGGVSCEIEGSIHGLRKLFEKKSSNGFGLLLLDAKNAFNSINRSSALLNARTLWSRASTFLYNSYQESSKLVLSNTDVFIRSEEGTTQGDPLSMLFYGVALLPLI